MRVKGFQKENGGIRVELDEGQLLFWSVKIISFAAFIPRKRLLGRGPLWEFRLVIGLICRPEIERRHWRFPMDGCASQ